MKIMIPDLTAMSENNIESAQRDKKSQQILWKQERNHI